MDSYTHVIKLLSVGILLTFNACKKDKDKDPDPNTPPGTSYTCATCVKSPEAKAIYDGSSRGIYKGILVASTGTIRFSVGNDDNSVVAVMVIDGTQVTLSSSITWTEGEPYVAPFTGVMNGDSVSIAFSVQADGSDPRILAASIPGHPNATFTVVKETSNALIEGFEGNYSIADGKKGIFNILLSRTLKRWGGVTRENGTSEDENISGRLDGDKIINRNDNNLGTLSGDEISGNFQNSSGKTVTISGKRTL